MECLYCGGQTTVVNSRHQRRNNHIWRRRKCLTCSQVFTTTEQAELKGSVMLRGAHGKLQPFSRDQLFVTIYESCRHRKSAVADATLLTDIISSHVLTRQKDGIIARDELIKTTLVVLKRLDKAAATAYAAYHPL